MPHCPPRSPGKGLCGGAGGCSESEWDPLGEEGPGRPSPAFPPSSSPCVPPPPRPPASVTQPGPLPWGCASALSTPPTSEALLGFLPSPSVLISLGRPLSGLEAGQPEGLGRVSTALGMHPESRRGVPRRGMSVGRRPLWFQGNTSGPRVLRTRPLTPSAPFSRETAGSISTQTVHSDASSRAVARPPHTGPNSGVQGHTARLALL